MFWGTFNMHSIGRNLLVAGAAMLATLAFSPALADVKSGIQAWQAGNYPSAIAQWRPLAEAGDADAQFNMGQAFMLGRGVPSDPKTAQGWYEKAAKQGHEPAQANLGLLLFQNGQREAAMPWIEKAADYGDPRAQYVLGTALFNGDIVGQDYVRAYALMTRAAAQGLPPATTSLTEMDKHIAFADRQKGIALAQQLERKELASAERTLPVIGKPIPSGPPPSMKAAPAKVVAAPKAVPTPKAVPKTVVADGKIVIPKPVAVAAAKPTAAKPTATPPIAAPGGKWRIQLGAFASPAVARQQWGSISKRIGAFAGLQASYEPAGALTRLRVGPLASRAAADKACAAAKAGGQACFPVAP
jgi:cell division septation protein DedD